MGKTSWLGKPLISGRLGDAHVGFLTFIEAFKLRLDYYSYEGKVNSSHREREFIDDAT